MFVQIVDKKIVGGYNEHMGHGTTLCVGGQLDYDDRCGNLFAGIPAEGDHIIFEIPSGYFEGVVLRLYPMDECQNKKHAHYPGDKYYNMTMIGTWIGKYYGLTGGRSSYGDFSFTIDDYTLIVSSWGIMEYREYQLIRILRDNADIAESAIKTYRKITTN